MSAPPLRRLTPREQVVADFFRRRSAADVALAIAAAVVGLSARGLAQAYCHSAPSGPSPGTAGARYCARVSPATSWIVYALVAVVLAGAIRAIFRHKPYGGWVALVGVSALAISATVWVYSLPDGFG